MLEKNSGSLMKASLILIFVTALSKLMGLIRELVIANQFGASRALDNYLLAFTIPTAIVSILMYAVPSLIIPRLAQVKVKSGTKLFWQAGSYLINIGSVLILCISIGSYLMAFKIIHMLAPAISEDDFVNSVRLLRILSIYLAFGGIFPVLKGILHTEKVFLLPGLVPLSVHITLIFSILLFSNEMGNRSMAYGLSGGAVIQFLIIYLYLFRRGLKPQINLKNIYFNSIHLSFFIIVIIEIIGQIFAIIDRYFASQIEGIISALNYSMIVFMLPVSLFGLAIGAAIFPALSDFIAIGNWEKLKTLIRKSIILIAGIGLPIFIILFLFPELIISILFERGAFDSKATELTADALKSYSVGLIAVMMHTVFTKAYYSLGLEKVLLTVGGLSIMLKIYLSKILFKSLMHSGLALATSITFIITVIILWGYLEWYLRRH
jgi:putative peptidoglycan lipid II flippase